MLRGVLYAKSGLRGAGFGSTPGSWRFELSHCRGRACTAQAHTTSSLYTPEPIHSMESAVWGCTQVGCLDARAPTMMSHVDTCNAISTLLPSPGDRHTVAAHAFREEGSNICCITQASSSTRISVNKHCAKAMPMNSFCICRSILSVCVHVKQCKVDNHLHGRPATLSGM